MERCCHATAWSCHGRGDQGAVMQRHGEASGGAGGGSGGQGGLGPLSKFSMGTISVPACKVLDQMAERNKFLNFANFFGVVDSNHI